MFSVSRPCNGYFYIKYWSRIKHQNTPFHQLNQSLPTDPKMHGCKCLFKILWITSWNVVITWRHEITDINLSYRKSNRNIAEDLSAIWEQSFCLCKYVKLMIMTLLTISYQIIFSLCSSLVHTYRYIFTFSPRFFNC